MTAKLPPPPMLRGFPDESGEEWFTKRQLEDALKSYALQAVRDALEELKLRLGPALEWEESSPCAGAHQETAKQAWKTVGALLKEYSDE